MVASPRAVVEALDPIDTVAASLVHLGSNTLGPRLFRERVLPGIAAGTLAVGGAGLRALLATLGVPSEQVAGRMADLRRRAASCLEGGMAAGLGVIGYFDPAYPEVLRQIPDPPLALWFTGALASLTHAPAVAVVGSRRATPEGLALARRLGRGLAEAGITVVSGLARGIDAAAHRGALDAAGSTVAVLGSGADVIYPAGHRDLAGEVVGRGSLVSELPPGTPPLPRHFPLRNRIISGLSRAVVVVQASDRSGSLITARMALEQGRDVLAVPGGVAAGQHRGCHALIQDGARLVETVEDILDEIGWRPEGAARRRDPSDASANPQADLGLAAHMTPGAPADLDALATRTGRDAGDLLAELVRLELAGRVARLPGGQFVRLD